MKSLELLVERIILSSRWLLVVFYLGLVAALLLVTGGELAFIVGTGIGAIVWGTSIPYVLALCTMGSARGAAWASFVAKLGLAAGPVLGGMIVAPGHYASAVVLGGLLSIGALLLLVAGERPRAAPLAA